MLRTMNGWTRLAVLLSSAWLIGIAVYTAFSWKNPAGVRSPFVDWWYTYELVGLYQQRSVWNQSFDGLTFTAVTLGGLAMIWLSTVGLVWTIRGLRTPASAENTP
jgi:hypothetical protein